MLLTHILFFLLKKKMSFYVIVHTWYIFSSFSITYYYFLCLIERKKSTDENNLQLCLTSIEPIEPKKKKEGLFLREGELIATVCQYGLSSFFGEGYKIKYVFDQKSTSSMYSTSALDMKPLLNTNRTNKAP